MNCNVLREVLRTSHDSLTATPHDSPRTQYFLSTSSYFVYKITCPKRSDFWAVIYSLPDNNVCLEQALHQNWRVGQSHCTVWGPAALPTSSLRIWVWTPSICVKNLMQQHAPVTRSWEGRERQMLGASWPVSLTIQQRFQMQWNRISKKRCRSWKNTQRLRAFTVITEDLSLFPSTCNFSSKRFNPLSWHSRALHRCSPLIDKQVKHSDP